MKNIIIIIVLVSLVLFIISIIYSYFKLDVSYFNVKNKKIDKNIKIMFLSDLHNRNINTKIKEISNKEKPDIIIFGGDMVNESISEVDNFINLYNELKNNKIYYVFGNHEEKLNEEDMDSFYKLIDKNKIKVIYNDKINLSSNVILYGFTSGLDSYLKFRKKGLNKKYIIDRINTLDKNKYNILVAHNPLEFDSYVDYGCDLVLSGHVHGGLMRIPFLKGVLSPDYTFFPKYSEGEYIKNNTHMIVSRGIGFSKRIPIRVSNPAEVVIINIMKD